MRKTIILLFMVFTIGAILGFFYWPNRAPTPEQLQRQRETEQRDLASAQKLLEGNQGKDAMQIIHSYDAKLSKKDEFSDQWRDLFIEASMQTENTSPLIYLYEYFPNSFQNHERASILVGNALLLQGKTSNFDKLRDMWKGRETEKEQWFILDVNDLLAQGNQHEAINLLKSQNFKDQKKESARLVKLALLQVYDQPREAWENLESAYKLDPQNSGIRSYRGKLLEVVGKNPLALGEYIAAVQTEPSNKILQDQLADFYLRSGKYQQALSIWEKALASPSYDFIWLKAFFWNRVTTPIKFDWKENKSPQGPLKPLVDYLSHLKPNQFWDKSLFESTVLNGSLFLNSSQDTFWLRLLQMLKDKNETGAIELLMYNPYVKESWNPELELALRRILQYRKEKTFISEEKFSSDTVLSTPSVPFFEQLKQLSKKEEEAVAQGLVSPPVPADVASLISSPDAFAAAFLATGWFEAGLELHTLDKIPDDFPDWYALLLTEALRTNRGDDIALEFASKQKQTSALRMMIAEILIASGKKNDAIADLEKLSNDSNEEIANKAKLLLSLLYLENGNVKKAKEIVNSSKTFSQQVAGQETLAKIALKEGNKQEAEKIYSGIKDKSLEAKSYFAKKAFKENDLKTARELIEELLKEYPDNPVLQENYQKILEFKQKSTKE